MEDVIPLRALDVPATGSVADTSTTPLGAATGLTEHVVVFADVAATAGRLSSTTEQEN